jgi:translation initiation factor IF-2
MQGRQSLTEGDSGHVGKVRVYEVAKEVGLPNKALVAKVRGLGIDVKNHMSSIDLDDVQRVKRALEKERVENREEKRISATVIRRRSRGGAAPSAPPPAAPVSPEVAAPAHPASELSATPETVEQLEKEPKSEGEQPTAEAATGATVEQPSRAALATAMEEGASSEATPEAASAATPQPASEVSEPSEPTEAAAEGEAPTDRPAAAAGDDAAGSTPAVEAKPAAKAPPKREIRYAPGYGPNARPAARPQPRGPAQRPTPAADAEPVSAAEAAKMMLQSAQPRPRPKVVITDLDTNRREVGRKDLFQDRRRAVRGRKKRLAGGKKGKKTEITMPAEHKRVIRVEDTITVGEIARQMGVKATEVLKKLWADGLTNVTITQSLDIDSAGVLAADFGYEIEDVAFREDQVLKQVQDAPEDMQSRAPVVTVMGHVDHGKTSLLDAIRGADVVSGEAGGITQHIGAYRVETGRGTLVFLDTPGHEAFTAMRARGAQCTDIVVLIVAADDGVMPTTVEAIDHARDAGVQIVVAINKVDRPDANPDRVRTQLAERDLVPEEWGGETLFVEVSAHTKQGIDELLENLLLQSELLELKANAKKTASGSVIEARMDRARGPMCTVLVQEGTLHVGDTVVVGEHVGKVRALLNDRGANVDSAGPSMPVEILGLSGVPGAGDALNALEDEKAARQLAEFRHNQSRRRELGNVSAKATYEDILGQIQSGNAHELKVLIKSDVQGSAEAIKESLAKLGTDKVSVNVISTGVGGIHETDVNLAKAAGAVIIGFNVRSAGKASQLAEREGVEIRVYDVIYELLDDAKSLMRGLLPKERAEKALGRLEVRQTFTIPKVGTIAGCFVVDGKINRAAHLRLVRDNVKIYEGKVGSLRRFKDDVREVVQGYECGASIAGYNDIREGDVIEAYELEEVTPDLE